MGEIVHQQEVPLLRVIDVPSALAHARAEVERLRRHCEAEGIAWDPLKAIALSETKGQ